MWILTHLRAKKVEKWQYFGNEIALLFNVKIIQKKMRKTTLTSKKRKIEEICGELDADIYWKNCNFLENEDDDEIPTFYSRDDCCSISFRELLLWYLPRLGEWQDEPNCDNCDQKDCNNFMHTENCKDMVLDRKIKQKHYALFLELVDIYAYYTQRDHVEYKKLKNKCRDLIEEIMG